MALTKVSTGMLEAGAASVDLNLDDGTLYIDVANGRVGVGTTTPSTSFEVSGDTTLSSATVSGALGTNTLSVSSSATIDTLTVSTTATVPYDNTISGLTATNVQSAITELNTLLGGGNVGSQATWNIYEFTTTANQTQFDISTQGSPAPSYVPGYVKVYLNGLLLSESDYTAVDGSTVNFSPAIVDSGQIVSIVVLDSFNTAELLRVTSIDASASTNSITLNANDDLSLLGSLSFADNEKAIFGAGSDLQIYHDGSNSYVKDAGTGQLILQGSTKVILKGVNGDNFLQGNEDGAVNLYHNDSQKLATTSTGIDVTGTVTADGLTVDGSTTFTGNTSPASDEVLLNLSSLNGTGTAGNMLRFTDLDPTATNNGSIGKIQFYSDDTDAVVVEIEGQNADASPDGRLIFKTAEGTTLRNRINIENNGDISFYEDTGTTAKLFWDASEESLGIGTSSPSTKLHLGGTAPGDSIIRQDSTVSGTNWEIGEREAGKWQIFEDDSDSIVATFMSSGNVGIGESNPSERLSLAKGISYNADSALFTTIGVNDSAVNNNAVYRWRTGITGSATGHSYTFSTLARTEGAYVERARIDSSGNVGIGRSSIDQPSAGATTLAIQGTDNNKAGAIRLYSADDSVAAYIYPDSTNGLSINTSTSHPMIFRTVGVERMRITSDGELLLNTTSNVGGAQFETKAPSNKHSRSIDSNSGITGSEERAVMAEGTVTANTTSLGTVLSIPFFSQSNVWRRYIIEFMFSSGEYNDSGNGKAGTATVKLATLNFISGESLLHSTGNVSSVGQSGMNLQITFSSGFTNGLNNYEGVQVYYKILGEVPGYCQIWNATLN